METDEIEGQVPLGGQPVFTPAPAIDKKAGNALLFAQAITALEAVLANAPDGSDQAQGTLKFTLSHLRVTLKGG